MSPLPQTLPGGEVLASDERLIRSASFRRSNIAPWWRVDLAITNKRLVGQEPHLFLWFRTGTQNFTYPLPNVASASVNNRVWIIGLLEGAVLGFFGLGAVAIPEGTLLGIPLMIGAVLIFVAAFACEIKITNNGGESITTQIAYFDRKAATAFVQEVSNVLISFTSQPSTEATQPPATVRGSPADALIQLARLKDDGLISADEFEAKRREILGRL